MFGMLNKIKYSKEFNEFVKGSEVYHSLVKQLANQEDRNIRGMVELELLNAAQLLGILLRSNLENEKFIKELTNYVSDSINNNNYSGLPSTKEFLLGNEQVIKNIFKDHKVDLTLISSNKDILIKFEKVLKHFSKFKKYFNIKRKMKMKPLLEVKFSLSVDDYKYLITGGYFTESELNKFTSKLSKLKENLFCTLHKESTTVEFYKEEWEDIFMTCMETPNEYDFSYLVMSNSYYLVNDENHALNSIGFIFR